MSVHKSRLGQETLSSRLDGCSNWKGTGNTGQLESCVDLVGGLTSCTGGARVEEVLGNQFHAGPREVALKKFQHSSHPWMTGKVLGTDTLKNLGTDEVWKIQAIH